MFVSDVLVLVVVLDAYFVFDVFEDGKEPS